MDIVSTIAAVGFVGGTVLSLYTVYWFVRRLLDTSSAKRDVDPEFE